MGITLARKVCFDCGWTTGLRLWRWSGRAFVTSHGLCRRCFHQRHPAIEGEPTGSA